MFSATKPPPASSGWSTLSSTVSGNDHCCRFMSSRSRIPSPALESKRSSALRYKRPLLRVPESPVRFEGHCPRSQVGSRLTGLADYRETARWGGARGVQGLSAAVRKRGSPRLVVSGDEVTKGVGKQPSTLVEANRTVQTLVGTRRCGHTGPMRIE